ncbi:MAG: HAMP domain-containing sensor histidine kinase [Chloroflexota bacterium]|nr:MAG: HAMP domain-containing sensor histidine kinase [Chloroflexota bacterium]
MSERLHEVTAPFRRLRWQLILSYTIVTIGALLVAVLIMAGLLFSRLFPSDDRYTPADWQQIAGENIAPLVRPFLTTPSVDEAAVSELLNQARVIMPGRPFFSVGELDVNTSISAEIHIALVDAAGHLVATSDEWVVPGARLGQPLDVESKPVLAQPLAPALAGETDPDQLFTSLGSGDAIFVTPIFNQPGSQETVLGAAVVDYSALPTQRDVLDNALAAAGRAFLFFVIGAGLLGAIFGSITAGGLVRRFERFSITSESWSRGDLSARVADDNRDEIGQLAGKLDAMAARLEKLLRRRQEIAVAEERNRMARDLHDSAKQQAFAASAQIGAALALEERDPAQAREHLQEAQKLVDRVRAELTDLILKLRPANLQEGGLPVALREYAVDWAQQNNIEVDVQVSGDGQLPLEVDQALYRVTQEALANTARHSGATTAGIKLAYDDGQVTLTIGDDGRGFNPKGDYGGLGLRSMQERAELIGGRLQVDSAAGEGTRITATWPAAGETVAGEQDG